MPNFESPGTENMRANHKAMNGADTASPSGGGKDAGGTANLRANPETKQGSTKQTQTFSKDNRPAGVQTFSDKAV